MLAPAPVTGRPGSMCRRRARRWPTWGGAAGDGYAEADPRIDGSDPLAGVCYSRDDFAGARAATGVERNSASPLACPANVSPECRFRPLTSAFRAQRVRADQTEIPREASRLRSGTACGARIARIRADRPSAFRSSRSRSGNYPALSLAAPRRWPLRGRSDGAAVAACCAGGMSSLPA